MGSLGSIVQKDGHTEHQPLIEQVENKKVKEKADKAETGDDRDYS
jgi:hypothetical protein